MLIALSASIWCYNFQIIKALMKILFITVTINYHKTNNNDNDNIFLFASTVFYVYFLHSFPISYQDRLCYKNSNCQPPHSYLSHHRKLAIRYNEIGNITS